MIPSIKVYFDPSDMEETIEFVSRDQKGAISFDYDAVFRKLMEEKRMALNETIQKLHALFLSRLNQIDHLLNPLVQEIGQTDCLSLEKTRLAQITEHFQHLSKIQEQLQQTLQSSQADLYKQHALKKILAADLRSTASLLQTNQKHPNVSALIEMGNSLCQEIAHQAASKGSI